VADPVTGSVGQATPLGDLVAWRLILAARAARGLLDRELASADDSFTGYAVICALAEAGPQVQQALARRVELSEATLARQVDRMERAGLVKRERPAGNRRTVRVELTPHGAGRYDALARVAHDVERRLARGLTGPQRERLLALLGQVDANLRSGREGLGG